jgi:hypothetical protein
MHQFLGRTSGSGVRDVGGSSPRGCGGRWLGWTHREDAGEGRTHGRRADTRGTTHQLFVLLPVEIPLHSFLVVCLPVRLAVTNPAFASCTSGRILTVSCSAFLKCNHMDERTVLCSLKDTA